MRIGFVYTIISVLIPRTRTYVCTKYLEGLIMPNKTAFAAAMVSIRITETALEFGNRMDWKR